MHIRRISLALPLLLVMSLFTAALAQTQAGDERKSCEEYRRVDEALNRAYQLVLSKYSADALFIKKLKGAQRAWLAFRDVHVESRFPALDPQRAYGSAYGECRCEELVELTRQRTDQLLDWVRGREAGDVCAGSVQIRGYTGGRRRRAKPNKSLNRTRNSVASHHQRLMREG